MHAWFAHLTAAKVCFVAMVPGGKRCAHCGAAYESTALFCPRDGKPLTPDSQRVDESQDDPFVGLALNGAIEVESLIGVGSMGRVYQARDRAADRRVAVKILRPDLGDDEHLVARFHREAEIASRLSHPGVIRVMSSGTIDAEDLPKGGKYAAGSVYLVMEFLDGISLLSALNAAGADDRRTLPLKRAMGIVEQIGDALAAAHAVGIVHRDLKPENVMLMDDADGCESVKVLDFGIARLIDERSKFSREGLVFGSAAYISPEGAEGLEVDARADVYALATLLYECLAGHTPFHGEPAVRLLMRQVSTEPPSLREVAPDVPMSVAEVVMSNLAKDPDERAGDAGGFLAQLRACRWEESTTDRSPPDEVVLPASGTTRALGGPSVDGPDMPVASIDIPLDSLESGAPTKASSEVAEARDEAADDDHGPGDRGGRSSLLKTQPSGGQAPPPFRYGMTLRSDLSPGEVEQLRAAQQTRVDPVRVRIQEASELPEASSSERPPPVEAHVEPDASDRSAPSSAARKRRRKRKRRDRMQRRAAALVMGVMLVALGFVAGRAPAISGGRSASETTVRRCLVTAGCDVEARLAAHRHRYPPRGADLLGREVADRLVAEALHLKYAGRGMEAARRLSTARRIAPDGGAAKELEAQWRSHGGSSPTKRPGDP